MTTMVGCFAEGTGESMHSDAKTVAEYLAGLPDDRRRAIRAVRTLIRKRLPPGYEETMNWGMITYQVPLKTYPDTYNGEPLMYAALASQKHHMAVYLTGIYASQESRAVFETAYRATGKRFDVGKSCVRFTKLDDLPLPLIGETIGSMPVAVLGRARHGRDLGADGAGQDNGHYPPRREEAVKGAVWGSNSMRWTPPCVRSSRSSACSSCPPPR